MELRAAIGTLIAYLAGDTVSPPDLRAAWRQVAGRDPAALGRLFDDLGWGPDWRCQCDVLGEALPGLLDLEPAEMPPAMRDHLEECEHCRGLFWQMRPLWREAPRDPLLSSVPRRSRRLVEPLNLRLERGTARLMGGPPVHLTQEEDPEAPPRQVLFLPDEDEGLWLELEFRAQPGREAELRAGLRRADLGELGPERGEMSLTLANDDRWLPGRVEAGARRGSLSLRPGRWSLVLGLGEGEAGVEWELPLAVSVLEPEGPVGAGEGLLAGDLAWSWG